MIVDAFLTAIRNVIYGDTITMPSHICIGTGTTAATASDTTLETEVDRNTISSRSKPATKKVRLQATIGANENNGVALTEFGAINAVSGGTLTNRVVHTAINKTSVFELKYQVTIKMSDL
ncbi:MAG: hypothetical protein BA871_06785 [Desulfuromonadales bacterium C00003096]|jgi:hypothetical protein|nr:MAG: hypothetical protein BA871_06785 [Desulfuromonadales bacterium C00003096]